MKACTRCGGFLMIENWLNSVGDLKQKDILGTRCVNCGSIDDPVILVNRRQPHHTPVKDKARHRERGESSVFARQKERYGAVK
ncbi:MAG: hypothetical protein K0S45_3772 [Nitrospira sp.]|nr:hypothetical protein [Nitrospira sp.]